MVRFEWLAVALLGSSLWAQNSSRSNSQNAPHASAVASEQMSDMHDMPAAGEGGNSAMQAMEGHHMDMGPHMKLTSLRPLQPGDQEKADQVVAAARTVAAKYQDYKVALADGYKIFLPNLPQKQYHFTNYWNGFLAGNRFDPNRPTSLLYEKIGEDYKLIGVMYTAKKDASEDELNSRIPLSIAQWHAHVNLCLPPRERQREAIPPNAKFGLAGSIFSKEQCDQAGGKFLPQIFGWMVHVYPFEQKGQDIWAVERQMDHSME
ncbi:MAG: hypothetical protein JO356_06465 [Acidobacteria bacterium]|nr:hypothetical protein [Acidobacteriota bacterium]